MATLEVHTDSQQRQFYELTGDEVVMGRDPFCDVVLNSRTVSRQHARILRTNEGYFIEDMTSLNGTFVNHQRVEGRVRISDQDRIHIYEIAMVFHIGAPEPTAADENAMAVAQLPLNAAAQGTRRSTFIKTLQPSPADFDLGSQAKFRAALRISRSLEGVVDVDQMLMKILDSVFAIFPQAARGYVLLAEPPDGHLVPRAIRHRSGESGNSMTFGPISRQTSSRVMSDGEALLIDENHERPDDQSIFDPQILSIICAPLSGPSRSPLGIIYIDEHDHEKRFTQEDLEVLVTVATIAGQEVENAFGDQPLYDPGRRRPEWNAAKQMQAQFLPQHRPEVEGYQFYDYYLAADDVGGDYYGYIPLPDGRLALAIGDVAGKGVSAALLMAHFASEVRYCIATSATPAEAVGRLNQDLAIESPSSRFVTFALCVLDPVAHTLTVVNAGHLPPLKLCSAAGNGGATSAGAAQVDGARVERLATAESGLPLGCDPLRVYDQVEVPLEPGDAVLLFTDGITEAMNVHGEVYGLAALQATLTTGPAQVEKLCLGVLKDIKRFARGSLQSDDMCLVCFSRDE